ncbi:hypothetical protein IFM89_025963 [Coptis chinensis]|uniref:Uncharacterized protein n=1 Tax=Coptis chinensis TaxID=261450 RepID=A0A835H2N7_9MAGN|nr:hypothetical protein IFM89_025963 [Coptis chinensis]
MALGVCLSHKAGDTSSLGLFLNNWAALTREDNDGILRPELDLTSVFPPRDVTSYVHTSTGSPPQKVINKRFVFDARNVAALKAKSSNELYVEYPTRVEAVSALIWRCAMKFVRMRTSGAMANIKNREPSEIALLEKKKLMTILMEELTDDTVRNMAIGAVFNDFGGKINSVDFHRTEDLLITTSEDDSVRLYDIANATLLKTTYHKKHGADRICFTHHPSSVICSSVYNLDSTGESLRYLSMYDNRCLRYFKGHKDRVISLCMSPINDSFMSGSIDHSIRIWDLR